MGGLSLGSKGSCSISGPSGPQEEAGDATLKEEPIKPAVLVILGGQWAASRIQRAWRLKCWRRDFEHFCETRLDYVGSLSWLQKRQRLYGTELAEPSDHQNWAAAYQVAPRDVEIDPWGAKRLREHLARMWA